jgi:hypothetical protein
MADSNLPSLAEINAPALEDLLYIVDDPGGTEVDNKITLSRLAGFLLHDICQGRLTLESGVAIPTTNQTAKTNVYFTPTNGEHVALFDGTRWGLYAFTEITLALGTITSGKNYDVFLYNNAGTLTLELSAAWTNDTTPADAITTQDGVAVKSGATTRRWLGTIRTTSTTTTEDSLTKRFVWNLYNRTARPMVVTETADSWAYGTNTVRQANGNTANKVEYVVGSSLELVQAKVLASAALAANSLVGAKVGVGVDSITTFSGIRQVGYNNNLNALFGPIGGSYSGFPGIGYHYLAWLEKGADGTTCTFLGDDGGNDTMSGLDAIVWG